MFYPLNLWALEEKIKVGDKAIEILGHDYDCFNVIIWLVFLEQYQ